MTVMTISVAVLCAGVTLAVSSHEPPRERALQIIAAALVGAALGAITHQFVTGMAGGTKGCPENQVYVSPSRNSAGAKGCVPVDLLPQIAK